MLSNVCGLPFNNSKITAEGGARGAVLTIMKNLRGMEQKYYWLRNGFFTRHGLHYGQDVSCGELQTRVQRWHGCQHKATLFAGGVSYNIMFLHQPQTLRQETWPPKNSNGRLLLFLFPHLTCHTNNYGLKQPYLTLKSSIDRCTSSP